MPQWYKCFEVDFNRGIHHLFFVIEANEDFEEEDFPVVGEQVFLYYAEQKTMPRAGNWYDAGFGVLGEITDIKKGHGREHSLVFECRALA